MNHPNPKAAKAFFELPPADEEPDMKTVQTHWYNDPFHFAHQWAVNNPTEFFFAGTITLMIVCWKII